MKRYTNIAFTLLLASILVVALSFVLPKDKEKYLGDRFWTQKTFAPAKYNVILMGDSRVYRGLSPDVMEEKLPGMKILNFGYSNGGLNKTIFEMAEKKFSPESRNKVIVLGISPNCITGYSQNNEQFWQEKNRTREDLFERLYLAGMLYQFSATSPEGIRKLLKKQPSTSYYLNEYQDNGYVESEKFPTDSMESIPSYTQDYTNYKVENRLVDVVIRQVKEWSNKGIKVVGFRPPVSLPMRALEDTLGLYNETVIRVRFNEAGGKWVDLNPNSYKTYDGSHLDKRSAIRLSGDLASEIKSFLK